MPVHDWKLVDAGIFHDFHHEWISTIKHALNTEFHGSDFYALAEQIAGGLGPDVLTLQGPTFSGGGRKKSAHENHSGMLMVETAPPKATFRITDPPNWYASKKKSVTIRHVSGHRVVAVLEIVSPGNKDSESSLVAFVRKAQGLLTAGVHLSLVDLFPPTSRDPQGIHTALWGDDDGDTFHFDRRRPLTCASYIGGPGAQALVTPVAVGENLPDLPVFLTPEKYVAVKLEATYREAFAEVPEFWRKVLDRGRRSRA